MDRGGLWYNKETDGDWDKIVGQRVLKSNKGTEEYGYNIKRLGYNV